MTEMPYQDWIARGPAVCNAECAEAMGWRKEVGDKALWVKGDGIVQIAVADFHPTTDRNATAMMVERVVELRRKSRFTDLLLTTGEGLDSSFMVIAALIAAPSLVAYCAWRALKEEGGRDASPVSSTSQTNVEEHASVAAEGVLPRE